MNYATALNYVSRDDLWVSFGLEPKPTEIVESATHHLVKVVYHPTNDQITRVFGELAERWKEETLNMSSISDVVLHPAYLQIIAMGRAVIPLLIDELRREPNLWFTALSAITQDDPVNPEDEGDLFAMTEAWVEWGRAHGF